MTIKQFIEKAIDGEWYNEKYERALNVAGNHRRDISIEMFYAWCLLDPLAWQAVGRVSGWGAEMTMVDEPGQPKEWCFFEHCDKCGATINDQEEGCPYGCESDNSYIPEWQYNMNRMIDALCDEKTLEEAVEIATTYEP